jgi:hypothetical protein
MTYMMGSPRNVIGMRVTTSASTLRSDKAPA